MVKRLTLFAISCMLLLGACDFNMLKWTNRSESDSVVIQRYDRVQSRYLTTGDFAALQEMNTVYPKETRALIEDILKLGGVADADINKRLLDFYRDSTLQNVIYAAESEYADMADITEELRRAFTTLQKQIPGLRIPKFYAQIGAFDQSVVIDDNDVGISLDKYLGEDYPAYHRFYDNDQRKTMTRQYIVPDCIVFYLWSLYPPRNTRPSTQFERDMHIAKFMWIADFVTKKRVFANPFTDRVERFMRNHPDTSLLELIETNNYEKF